MKRTIVASVVVLGMVIFAVGCGEPVPTAAPAVPEEATSPSVAAFVVTEGQKEAAEQALAARDRLFMGLPEAGYAMTDAQRQAANEAVAARDRVLMGDSAPSFVMTDAERQAADEALAARDRLFMGY